MRIADWGITPWTIGGLAEVEDTSFSHASRAMPGVFCYRKSDFVTAKSDLLAGEKYCTVIDIVRELAEGPSFQRGVSFVSYLIHQH